MLAEFVKKDGTSKPAEEMPDSGGAASSSAGAAPLPKANAAKSKPKAFEASAAAKPAGRKRKA